MTLPIDDMLRDADAAWKARDLGPAGSLLGGMARHVRALAEEVERLKAQLASTGASHAATKVLALRAARQRNALTRMCVHSNRPGEWWAFVGNFGPVPYASLVKCGSEEEAKAVVRETAAARAVAEETDR